MILRWWKSSWSRCLCSIKDVESRSQTTTQEGERSLLSCSQMGTGPLDTSACWSGPCAGDPYQKKWFDSHREFSLIPSGWGHEGSQGSGHNGRLFQSRHKLHFNPGDKNDGRTTWKDTIKYLEPCEGRPLLKFKSFETDGNFLKMLLLEVKERFVLKIVLNSHKSFLQKSYITEHE